MLRFSINAGAPGLVAELRVPECPMPHIVCAESPPQNTFDFTMPAGSRINVPG